MTEPMTDERLAEIRRNMYRYAIGDLDDTTMQLDALGLLREVERLREREKVLKDVPDSALPMIEQVIERCFVLGRFMGSKGARSSLAITCEILAQALVPNPPVIKFFEKDTP